jgi:hypothetical protein
VCGRLGDGFWERVEGGDVDLAVLQSTVFRREGRKLELLIVYVFGVLFILCCMDICDNVHFSSRSRLGDYVPV